MTNALAVITISVLVRGVHLVENPDNIKGVHKDGVSHGYLGTTQGCLDDVNAHYKTNYRLSDMDSPALALEVFQKYTTLRCEIKHLPLTTEYRLRMWHGSTSEQEQQRYLNEVFGKIEEMNARSISLLGGPHRCGTCAKEFPTCDAEKIVWGIDRDPFARGADADKVLECDAYTLNDRGDSLPPQEKTDGQ